MIAAFGAEFAKQLAAQPTGEWRGPVTSSYGLHLVRVEARMEPRAVKFDEVRETVVRDLNDERRRDGEPRGLRKACASGIEVTVDEAALDESRCRSTRHNDETLVLQNGRVGALRSTGLRALRPYLAAIAAGGMVHRTRSRRECARGAARVSRTDRARAGRVRCALESARVWWRAVGGRGDSARASRH